MKEEKWFHCDFTELKRSSPTTTEMRRQRMRYLRSPILPERVFRVNGKGKWTEQEMIVEEARRGKE